jgi:hypothetical protein
VHEFTCGTEERHNTAERQVDEQQAARVAAQIDTNAIWGGSAIFQRAPRPVVEMKPQGCSTLYTESVKQQ